MSKLTQISSSYCPADILQPEVADSVEAGRQLAADIPRVGARHQPRHQLSQPRQQPLELSVRLHLAVPQVPGGHVEQDGGQGGAEVRD